MKKKIVICGDSYAYGIGCINLDTQPFGVLTANHFNWDLTRLARGSASNYSIFLQGMYAADMENAPHLIVLSATSYDRVEWVKETLPDDYHISDHSLVNLNYHQYPPHQAAQPHHTLPMDYHLSNTDSYDPYILTEQVGGIDDCIKVRKSHPTTTYYARLDSEPTEKLQMIVDHYVSVSSYPIKRNYDIGMILQAYTYIKRKGIHCVVLTSDIDLYKKFFNHDDLMFQDWGALSLQYPDRIKSMHTSEEGHADTAARLIRHISGMSLG